MRPLNVLALCVLTLSALATGASGAFCVWDGRESEKDAPAAISSRQLTLTLQPPPPPARALRQNPSSYYLLATSASSGAPAPASPPPQPQPAALPQPQPGGNRIPTIDRPVGGYDPATLYAALGSGINVPIAMGNPMLG